MINGPGGLRFPPVQYMALPNGAWYCYMEQSNYTPALSPWVWLVRGDE